jgi:hypothetical protein
MTTDSNNGGVRFVEDVFGEAVDTLDRLRDLKPREPTIHVPTREERRQAEIEADEQERRLETQARRQREREMADAVELQAAEQEVESEEQWNAWLRGHLAAERTALLEALGAEFTDAVNKLRAEFGEQISEVRKQVEAERAVRRRDRERALERLKGVRSAHAEKVAALEAKVTAQERAIGLLEIRLHKTRTETARRAETEEAVAVMMRALYEELMLRR